MRATATESVPRVSELQREQLVELPPTEDVLDCLRACQQAVAALETMGRESPPHLVADHEHFAQLLVEAEERDRQTAARRQLGAAYAECWCLGVGGRRLVGLALRTDAHGVISDGRTGYGETCSCPDGVLREDEKQQVLSDLRCQSEERLSQKLLSSAQVPQRYQAASIEAWRDRQLGAGSLDGMVDYALLVIERWHQAVEENEQHGSAHPSLLLLVGDYGTGKTYLAVAMLRAWVAQGRSGLLWTVQELLDEVRAGFGTPASARTMLGVKRCPLLVLDDLGAEALSGRTAEWAVPTVLELLAHRQARCLPTIVTSNLRPQELSKRLGGRVAERAMSTETSLVASLFGLANLRGARW